MLNETEDFVEAIEQFLKPELRASMEPADYNNEAIEIIDARNHLFRNVGRQTTDEELNIYAIRDLCCVDHTQPYEIQGDCQRLLWVTG